MSPSRHFYCFVGVFDNRLYCCDNQSPFSLLALFVKHTRYLVTLWNDISVGQVSTARKTIFTFMRITSAQMNRYTIMAPRNIKSTYLGLHFTSVVSVYARADCIVWKWSYICLEGNVTNWLSRTSRSQLSFGNIFRADSVCVCATPLYEHAGQRSWIEMHVRYERSRKLFMTVHKKCNWPYSMVHLHRLSSSFWFLVSPLGKSCVWLGHGSFNQVILVGYHDQQGESKSIRASRLEMPRFNFSHLYKSKHLNRQTVIWPFLTFCIIF